MPAHGDGTRSSLHPTTAIPSSHHTPPRRAPSLGDFTADRRMFTLAGLALVIGVICALIAVALMALIGLITNLAYYHRFSLTLVSPSQNLLGVWAIPIPVIGGIIIGFMARYGSERIRGHGIPEAMETILIGGSKVEPRLAILKPISSALSIGTGGPFGAEGPIILTGGAFGSLIAQFFHLSAAERKTLLVAGAAAGMAATFNAPIASILLATELLLFEWKPRSIIPVALASGIATVLRRAVIHGGPMFPVGHYTSLDVWGLLGACFVGVVGGLLAWALTLGVYGAEDAFRKLPIHWMWWPALGGIVVGIGGLFFPRALGVGYDTIADEFKGNLPLQLLIGIIIAKAVIWCIALGSGTSGGILAPLLLIGGALGGIEGHFLPGHSAGLWALIGMAAALAGVMRSPLTSIVFALELTYAFDLALALLFACFIAHGISVLLLKRSILTEKVARRGYHLSREYAVDPLEVLQASEVMRADVVSVAADLRLGALHRRMTAHPGKWTQRLYPALDDDDRMVGVVTRTDLARVTNDDDRQRVRDIMHADPVVAYPDETLRSVAARMITANVWRLPVVARDDPHRLLGLISQRELLRARERLLVEERERERVLHLRILASGGKSLSRQRRAGSSTAQMTDQGEEINTYSDEAVEAHSDAKGEADTLPTRGRLTP
jgi:chloride channel protein, CIC family